MSFKDTAIFVLAGAASHVCAPFSSRTARRFKSSADKRDPRRRDSTPAIDATPVGLDATRAVQGTHEFVPYAPPAASTPAVRLIAHYLPQFHPFAENDAWWGKGFTEWTNVGKAVPNFPGHYQPHCPIHLGYYDLRIPEVMEEQAKIAREYGIGGFSYYFYWFGGKTLMEKPLRMMLENPVVDMPFCLIWANESWTRRWAGRAQEVLMAQEYSIEDAQALVRHLKDYMDDPRYIRIDGRPVLVIYRADIIPDVAGMAQAMRAEAEAQGFAGLYLIAAQSFDVGAPEKIGFDAAMEFPPHQIKRKDITDTMGVTNPDFTGAILDYDVVVQAALEKPEPDYKLFRSATLSWDNTARNQNAPRILAKFSLDRYRQWLSHLCQNVLKRDKYGPDEKIVFINAWNEWAEGTHLEPDRKFGFGYLAATHEAVPKTTEMT
ncbi:glycoside hydrolase family 99-like domain-containing protein [Tropicimonas sp. S265A]|uniref:glycosyltransferase WbsX family protein n=1 Tax=Tropicimonas sp. S265A TaxID=3415134 RepID=UPI003C79AC44